jgi:hypothetical protein
MLNLLNDKKYEDTYAETLRCLRAGHVVGPTFHSDGFRYCGIDGWMCTDSEVLRIWWGAEIAMMITAGRSQSSVNRLAEFSA